MTTFDGSFHAGETAIHSLLRVPGVYNPTVLGLPQRYAYRAAASPLFVAGALDEEGRPWVTVWGGDGEGGICALVAPGILGVRGTVDYLHDPVIRALFGDRAGTGEVVKAEAEGGEKRKLMAALSIDLGTRDRVKFAGRFVAGAVSAVQDGKGDEEEMGNWKRVGDMQMAFSVRESIGNCPKYVNKKVLRAVLPEPEVVEEGEGMLGEKSVEMVRNADMFFVSSWDGGEGMDVNHRGGPEGFLRVEDTGVVSGRAVLVWPEYSGNRLYQTLGNLHLKPLAGLAIPNYETGSVLYITGTTSILHGVEAANLLPHSKLAVRLVVSSSRLVRRGLSFCAAPGEPSPYNPPAWPLSCERSTLFPPSSVATAKSTYTASLTKREILTPNIARFTFSISRTDGGRKPLEWKAGQHITMTFAEELDMGYSHMRDDEPGSLNDDFVRTFTISSPPPSFPKDEKGSKTDGMFEITARRHGPATNLLFQHPVGRVELDLPILGVGGEERFRMSVGTEEKGEEEGEEISLFVAGGVGITPLLGQAPGLLEKDKKFEVLWSIRVDDLGLVADSIERIAGMAERIKLFVTGLEGGHDKTVLEKLQKALVKMVETRRITKEDVLEVVGDCKTDKGKGQIKRKFYCCTGPGLRKEVSMWLEGEDAVWEDFGY